MCERVYLSEHYLTGELTASITSVSPATADSKHGNHVMRLSKTIFHPQGGGQPSDTGTITTGGNKTFKVNFAQSVGDEIDHIGEFIDSTLEDYPVGCEVTLSIDLERRAFSARLHSAGHAMDAALRRLGYGSRLKPGKGYHFPDGAYVEYDGDLTADEMKTLPASLTECMRILIAEEIPSAAALMTRDAAASVCESSGDLSSYPSEVRVVFIADIACPCGGTHISNTKDLGALVVTKIKCKKGKVRLSYELK